MTKYCDFYIRYKPKNSNYYTWAQLTPNISYNDFTSKSLPSGGFAYLDVTSNGASINDIPNQFFATNNADNSGRVHTYGLSYNNYYPTAVKSNAPSYILDESCDFKGKLTVNNNQVYYARSGFAPRGTFLKQIEYDSSQAYNQFCMYWSGNKLYARRTSSWPGNIKANSWIGDPILIADCSGNNPNINVITAVLVGGGGAGGGSHKYQKDLYNSAVNGGGGGGGAAGGVCTFYVPNFKIGYPEYYFKIGNGGTLNSGNENSNGGGATQIWFDSNNIVTANGGGGGGGSDGGGGGSWSVQRKASDTVIIDSNGKNGGNGGGENGGWGITVTEWSYAWTIYNTGIHINVTSGGQGFTDGTNGGGGSGGGGPCGLGQTGGNGGTSSHHDGHSPAFGAGGGGAGGYDGANGGTGGKGYIQFYY